MTFHRYAATLYFVALWVECDELRLCCQFAVVRHFSLHQVPDTQLTIPAGETMCAHCCPYPSSLDAVAAVAFLEHGHGSGRNVSKR